MTIRFCPDCGAECTPQDQTCRECQFPLQLHLVSDGAELIIDKGQVNRWHRIAQILRRNGIKIETKARKFPAKFQLWWALPGLGALIFLTTLVFGGKVVDSIWPPPVQSARVLDLNQVPRKNGTPQAEAPNDESSDGADVDTSFLKEALGTSQAQEDMTQDLNLDPDDYVDRPELSQEVIEGIAKTCMLNMTVGDEQYRATLVSNRGLLLADQFAVGGAFQREKKMINTDGELKQTVVFIVPEVSLLDGTKVETEKVMESDALSMVLLRAPLTEGPDCEVEFDMDLAVGDTVFVASMDRGAFVLEKRSIISPLQSGENVDLWVLDRTVDPRGAGAPVFNLQGDLVGIHMVFNGQEAVLPMLRLRERAPQIYREILN